MTLVYIVYVYRCCLKGRITVLEYFVLLEMRVMKRNRYGSSLDKAGAGGRMEPREASRRKPTYKNTAQR